MFVCRTKKFSALSDSKTWTSEVIKVIVIKIECLVFNAAMHPKAVDGLANSVDPDQTAP